MMFAAPIRCPYVDVSGGVCGSRVPSLSEYVSVLYSRLPLSICSVEQPHTYTLLQGLVTFIPHLTHCHRILKE